MFSISKKKYSIIFPLYALAIEKSHLLSVKEIPNILILQKLLCTPYIEDTKKLPEVRYVTEILNAALFS